MCFLKNNLKKLIKRSLKFIISLCFFVTLSIFFIFFKKKSIKDSQKRILIVKLDAIGDYILFRNFLEEIKKDPKFSNYKITFLGNIVNKKIAESLDSKFIDEFIWLKKKNILFKPFYFFSILNNIKYHFNLILYPCYSREFIGDLVVKYSKADEKIGFRGDINCINFILKNISDKWYDNLVEINKDVTFEFYKNKEFFKYILNRYIEIIKPEIKKADLLITRKIDLPDNFVAFFPGAQKKKRRWSKDNFIEISKFLINDCKKNVVICGLKDDSLNINIDSLVDLSGETNLLESIYILSKADLVISNDTSGAHIAAALNITVIVLSQFNYYGRFFPYPSEIENIYCLFPPKK